MSFLPGTVLAATAEGSKDPGIYATLIPLLVLLPILGFASTALFGRRLQLRYGRWAAEIVPIGLIVLTWLVALAVIVPALQHAQPFGDRASMSRSGTGSRPGSSRSTSASTSTR